MRAPRYYLTLAGFEYGRCPRLSHRNEWHSPKRSLGLREVMVLYTWLLFEQGIEPAVGVTIDEFHDYPTDDTLEVVTEYPWDDNDYLFNDTYYHTYDHFYGYFFNFSYFDNYPDYAIDFNYTDYIDYDFNNTDYIDLGFNYHDYTFDYGFNDVEVSQCTLAVEVDRKRLLIKGSWRLLVEVQLARLEHQGSFFVGFFGC